MAKRGRPKEKVTLRMIKTNLIKPHPKNPRQDVGDVTELAESIKTNGIMQNLTVLDNGDGTYTALIGHRRLAASKTAGLLELPCSVVEVDEKEQIAIMLAENMQRADLTIVEQAQGVQMMLDLGESISGISERTGLSETTVRRRAKLAEYPKNSVEEAFQRGARLEDFAKIEELKDPAHKEKMLEYVGTNNFNWCLGQFKEEEDYKKILDEAAEIAKSFAKRNDSVTANYRQIYYLSKHNAGELKMNELRNLKDCSDGGEYCYRIDDGDLIVYTRKSDAEMIAEEESDRERKEEEKERKERIQKLNQISERIREARFDWAVNAVIKQAAYEDLIRLAVEAIKDDQIYLGTAYINVAYKLGYSNSMQASGQSAKDYYDMHFEDIPENGLLALIVRASESYKTNVHNYNGEYRDTQGEAVYWLGLLQLTGYEPSDEEIKYINGTHELFMKDENMEEAAEYEM